MRTLFFTWESKGKIEIADDPVYPTRQWIIRKAVTEKEYELIRVDNDKPITIRKESSVDFLKWTAVVTCLSGYNDLLHRAPYLLSPKDQESIQALMWILSDLYDSYANNNSAGLIAS